MNRGQALQSFRTVKTIGMALLATVLLAACTPDTTENDPRVDGLIVRPRPEADLTILLNPGGRGGTATPAAAPETTPATAPETAPTTAPETAPATSPAPA